jgi:hypothetical protein
MRKIEGAQLQVNEIYVLTQYIVFQDFDDMSAAMANVFHDCGSFTNFLAISSVWRYDFEDFSCKRLRVDALCANLAVKMEEQAYTLYTLPYFPMSIRRSSPATSASRSAVDGLNKLVIRSHLGVESEM